MRYTCLYYFIALLLALPFSGFGQNGPKVPVAPSLLFNIGGLEASTYPDAIKHDAQGNFYVMGLIYDQYRQVDFDPSAGVAMLGLNNSNFIAKYSAGGALVWVKPYNGTGKSLDIDHNGNITIIGTKTSKKAHDNSNLYRDAFVLHLDNSGNVLWEKLIESGTKDIPIDPDRLHIYLDVQTGYQVASDDAGNLVATFKFGGSPDVDGVVTAKGPYDGLVVKYDPNGNVIWKFNLGTTEDNTSIEALVDHDNNIIIAGYSSEMVNYNPLGTPFNLYVDNTMFLAKYSPDGILLWMKIINGNSTENNIKLALDGQDNIYINGSYSGPVDFGVAPVLNAYNSQQIFFAKYASDGNLLYHKSIGGGLGDAMVNCGLATGPDNSLYLTGLFAGTVDVDPSASVSLLKTTLTTDNFLVKYDDNGNYQWAFSIPGSTGFSDLNINLGFDFFRVGVRDLSVNSSDEIFLTGVFSSMVNFNRTGCGINSLTAINAYDRFLKRPDMFVVRYTPTIEKPITNNMVTGPIATDICPGMDPGLITGSIPVGDDFTYQWQQSVDNKTFTDITDAVSQDFDPPVPSATTYYRRRLVTSECAVPNISNVVTINLLTIATPNTIEAPAVTSFCNTGDVGFIQGSIPIAVGDVNYQWQQSTDNVNFTNIPGATGKDCRPPAISTTTYYRRLIINSPCSIGTPSNTVKFTVLYVPVPTVSAEQTVCEGDVVTLNATGGIRYSWSPAASLSATDIASPTAKPTETTNYTVTVFNGNCVTSLQVKVIVVKRPIVNAGEDEEIMAGDKVQLNAQVTDAEGAIYSWTPTTYLDNPSIANPIANPTDQITYRLTVSTASGCFAVSDEVTINVRNKLSVPNSFTPNGDGINDNLIIAGLGSYKQSTLTIFDRAGQAIFKSLADEKPWDGTHDGKPLPVGTYFYVIELNNFEHKRLSGYVYLMK